MKMVHVRERVYALASGEPSVDGGGERYLWLLSRALAASGWSVTVGVRTALEVGERRVIDGVAFVGLGAGNMPRNWYRLLMSERPDWWYWQGASHALGPAVAIAKLAGVRTIFSAMHDQDLQLRHALWDHPHWWPLYVWGLAWVDRIFVQHHGQLAQLATHWRHKASILPGIVGATTKVLPHAAREPYIAWAAVLREPKRPDVLLEIARRAPDLRFVVCGGPSDHRSPPGYGARTMEGLQALPNIDYLGHTTPEHTLHIIANAAVFLLTSDAEGFPSVFLEAWSGGTPVVSVNIDPDHLIERQRLGVISGDVAGTIAAIRALLDAPQRREEIAARARRFVAEAYSAEAAIKAFERGLHGGQET